MAEADPTDLHLAAFDVHRSRSRFLDAFARIEDQIGRLAKEVGLDPNFKSPIGHRIEALRKSLPDTKQTEPLRAKLEEVADLTVVRGHVVHAKIKELQDTETPEKWYAFLNAPFDRHLAAIFSADQMKGFCKRAFEVANELKMCTCKPAV